MRVLTSGTTFLLIDTFVRNGKLVPTLDADNSLNIKDIKKLITDLESAANFTLENVIK